MTETLTRATAQAAAPAGGPDTATATAAGPARVAAVVVALAAVTNVVVLSGVRLPFLGPLAGFGLLLGLPTWLVYLKVDWKAVEPVERFVYSLLTALFLLLVLGLAINTVLPLVGVGRALDRIPVLMAVDGLCVALGLWRRERLRAPRRPGFLRAPSRADRLTLALSALAVPMAVVGAVRINNGADSAVTFAMLVVVAAVLVLLLRGRDTLHPGTVVTAIYCVGLALLLMTSLRGWYTTGHDIQREYRVFQLTKSHGNWSISRFRDAYNACLSITILPTMVSQLTRVADVYVYKLFFQVLFALCPVLVFRIARRYASNGIALLAVIYFIAFPTYFGDMPFLNRQEIAFLFAAAAVLVMGDTAVPLRRKQVIFGVFSVGVVLSHYSTAYVMVGTLAFAWLAKAMLPALAAALRLVPSRAARLRARLATPRAASVIGLPCLFVMIVAIGVWNGAATQTSGGLSTTLSGAIRSIRGATSANGKSSDVSYNIFSLHKPSEQQRLATYASTTMAETAAGRAEGHYYSQSDLAANPTPLIPTPELGPTAIGRLVGQFGLNVSTLNAAVRLGSAKLLQLFVGLGLLAVACFKRRYIRTGAEFYLLGLAAFFIVLLQVVLPVLSVQYGVLRAFLQALIILGPFVAVGSVAMFSRLGERWAFRIAAGLAVFFFLSLSGVIPQALGGYPAQLQLNNAGEYYDLYYVHPQEVAGITWLQHVAPAQLRDDIQSEVVSDRYTFTPVNTFSGNFTRNDIYPTLLREDTYVFLGYPTVHSDEATISYEGDLLTYRYPTALLDRTKDLLYSSNGARVYR